MTVEVYYDGKLQKAVEITPKNLFTFDNKFVLEGDAVDAGPAHDRAEEEGHGPALLQRLPDQLHARRLHHEGRAGDQGRPQVLQAREGRQVDQGRRLARAGGRSEGREVRPPGVAEPGRRSRAATWCEIELEIDSKNDYEYLVFEDMKPAGFEPVDLRSGYTGNDLGAYVEFRDNRVVFFARTLARGKHSVSYRMRARNPRPVQRPAHPRLGDVRPGTEGHSGRDQVGGGGLDKPTDVY